MALKRSGAKVGDILLVSGTLGNSAAGRALLELHGVVKAEKLSRTLVQFHRRPQPRVVAARAARETGKVHACMDLSDGLAADLPKFCAASGIGARIDVSQLPLSDTLTANLGELDRPALGYALSGGEDYELLLAVAPADVEAVSAAVAATGQAPPAKPHRGGAIISHAQPARKQSPPIGVIAPSHRRFVIAST